MLVIVLLGLAARLTNADVDNSGITAPPVAPTTSAPSHIQNTAETCPAGYYCPTGSNDQIPCVQDQYCPEGTQTLIDCPDGVRCDAAAAPVNFTSGELHEFLVTTDLKLYVDIDAISVSEKDKFYTELVDPVNGHRENDTVSIYMVSKPYRVGITQVIFKVETPTSRNSTYNHYNKVNMTIGDFDVMDVAVNRS